MSIYSTKSASEYLRTRGFKVLDPWDIVLGFESLIAVYCGAKFAISLDSCTNALYLCLKYLEIKETHIEIPSRTYLSVPQIILQTQNYPVFIDKEWSGFYELGHTRIIDSAGRLSPKMYLDDSFMCLSFHRKKNIPIGKGGMILTDSKDAYDWMYKAVYEGRNRRENHDNIHDLDILGWNMYMTPEESAYGIDLFKNYAQKNFVEDCASSKKYRDLSKFNIFKSKQTI